MSFNHEGRRMNRSRLGHITVGPVAVSVALLALAAGAGCGNYSSEDVDYQLALPEQEDVSVKLPAQQALVTDGPEYQRKTRDVARDFNRLAFDLLTIVDHVRSLPPSERKAQSRVWGPFPHDTDRRFELGMVMDRVPDPSVARFGYRFAYAIKFRLRGSGAAGWKDLIRGSFAPSGGVRRGAGQLVLDLGLARAAGLPTVVFGDLLRLVLDYDTGGFPVEVALRFWDVTAGEVPIASYSYAEGMDGAGEMAFAYREPRLEGSSLSLRSRWQSAGAGQAEAEGSYKGIPVRGKDCWSAAAQATYSHRSWLEAPREPPPGACAFDGK
jgi:hypothetical protein